jgi:methyl-accepting chemotaxis protein WspA
MTPQTGPSHTPVSRRSLAMRLLFWFLLIALLPCGLLTAITASLANRALEETVRERLIQTAAARATQLEAYASERVQDGTTLARAPIVVTAVTRLREVAAVTADGATGQALQQAGADFNEFLTYVTASFGYRSLLLLDADGLVLYSIGGDLQPGRLVTDGPLATSELAAGFDRSRTLLQSEMGRFEPFGAAGRPLAFVTSPIFSDGQVVGVLALGLGSERVWQVLTDSTGLGATGEFLAAERVGDVARVTAPLRHRPDAAYDLTINLSAKNGLAARKASSGDRGYAIFPDYRNVQVAAAWCYLPSYRWGLVAKQDTGEAFALVRFQRLAISGLLIATVLIVTLVALFVARSISNPIKRAVDLARQVAAGDLRATVQLRTRDETSLLLEALQTMTTDLRSLIGRVQSATEAVAGTVSSLQTTGTNQEQVVTRLGESTTQTVAAVEEITVTGKELARTMDAVNEMAGNTGTMAIEGRENLASMDDTMRQLADSTASFGSRLAEINERAKTINLAVTTIAKVADQTNLLSINAAIEAEKAGEYGRGFLVIAREIRRLADQTAVASLEIEQVVKGMQLSVSSGVMEMDKFTKSVETGVEEIAGVSSQLAEIISSVKGISERFSQVTEGMQAQSQGAEQIRDAMTTVADGAARSEAGLDAFQDATASLQQAAAGLQAEIARFTL